MNKIFFGIIFLLCSNIVFGQSVLTPDEIRVRKHFVLSFDTTIKKYQWELKGERGADTGIYLRVRTGSGVNYWKVGGKPETMVFRPNSGLTLTRKKMPDIDSLVIDGSLADLSTTLNSSSVVVEINEGADAVIPAATTTLAGVMSAADKLRLDSSYNLENPSGTGVPIVHFPTDDRAVFKKLKFGAGFTATDMTDSLNITYDPGVGSVTLTGDVYATGTSPLNVKILSNGVTPGTYGTTTLIPQIEVDSTGRITDITTVVAAGGIGQTDLSMTYDANTMNIVSSSGVDATVSRATGAVAGAMGSSDYNRLWKTFYVKNTYSGGDTILYANNDTLKAKDLYIEGSPTINVSKTGSSDTSMKYTISSTNLSATPTIDFGSVAANSRTSATATVTGALVGDGVLVTPLTADAAGITWFGRVTSTNTVTIYANNFTTLSVDPPSGTFKVIVFKD